MWSMNWSDSSYSKGAIITRQKPTETKPIIENHYNKNKKITIYDKSALMGATSEKGVHTF